MLRPARRLVFLVALTALAACDGLPAPDGGAFTARVRGDVNAEYAGAAVFATDYDAEVPIPGGAILRAIVRMEDVGGAGGGVTLAFYDRVEVGTYREGVADDPRETVYAGFRAGGEDYGGRGGTVTVTRVTDAVVEGTFEVEGRCCGNSFAATPFQHARARGRFSARRDPTRTIYDLNGGR